MLEARLRSSVHHNPNCAVPQNPAHVSQAVGQSQNTVSCSRLQASAPQVLRSAVQQRLLRSLLYDGSLNTQVFFFSQRMGLSMEYKPHHCLSSSPPSLSLAFSQKSRYRATASYSSTHSRRAKTITILLLRLTGCRQEALTTSASLHRSSQQRGRLPAVADFQIMQLGLLLDPVTTMNCEPTSIYCCAGALEARDTHTGRERTRRMVIHRSQNGVVSNRRVVHCWACC